MSESLGVRFERPELVLALVGGIGTELGVVRKFVRERLERFGYDVVDVSISREVLPSLDPSLNSQPADERERIRQLMDSGDRVRRLADDPSVLALGAVSIINGIRAQEVGTDEIERGRYMPGRAYLISSLKRPEEVERLRLIYGQGFFLVGVHGQRQRRLERLTERMGIAKDAAEGLIERDEYDGRVSDGKNFGQRLTETFHLADFFVHWDGVDDHLRHSVDRILEVAFGHPYKTPTFDEFAMFTAFTASLRSADLSRQVGAVVAIQGQVVAMGANDCPKASGGLYWPVRSPQTGEVHDEPRGRDYTRGEDSNRKEQKRIIDSILRQGESEGLDAKKLEKILVNSRIRELTEFGRVVHAEMDALLSCARLGIPVVNGVLYSTTFPCHNCAKHIIAAGVRRVVYVEPYRKSMAPEFHDDSISVGLHQEEQHGDKVVFEPFVGIGPRRFLDLFSLRLGSGEPLSRNSSGKALDVGAEKRSPRLKMLPVSYLNLEIQAMDALRSCVELMEASRNEQPNPESEVN